MLKANGKSLALQNNRIFPVTNYTALCESRSISLPSAAGVEKNQTYT